MIQPPNFSEKTRNKFTKGPRKKAYFYTKQNIRCAHTPVLQKIQKSPQDQAQYYLYYYYYHYWDY